MGISWGRDRMRSVAFAMAVTVLAAPAAAEPARLSDTQMDAVTAGVDLVTILGGTVLAYGLYKFSDDLYKFIEWGRSAGAWVPELQKAIEEGRDEDIEGRYKDYQNGILKTAAEGVRAGGGIIPKDRAVVPSKLLDDFVDLLKVSPNQSSAGCSGGCSPKATTSPSSGLSAGPRYSIVEVREF
jgi:hypothetical protein